MKLKPLEQWYCDYCGGVIENADDGWLEWLSDRDTHHASGFKIVHQLPASPNKARREHGCYHYADQSNAQDMHLFEYVGPDGLAHLLAFLDAGYVDPEDKGPWVESTRELAELIRRLQIPHYEEARLLWASAVSDGLFDGANEMYPYVQSTLKRIIKDYSASV